MNKLPRAVSNLIDAFERLPGIGPKTAQRLAFYLINVPEHEITKFSNALVGLKKGTVKCSVCFNISEHNPCRICEDNSRDKSIILVVEQPIDVLHFERTGKHNGLYHVLHGRIDPLNNIGPEDIYIDQLLARIDNLLKRLTFQEVVLALSPDMEGEATSLYIAKKLRLRQDSLKITRLAHGLPVGSSIEFADEVTLSQALEGRREFN